MGVLIKNTTFLIITIFFVFTITLVLINIFNYIKLISTLKNEKEYIKFISEQKIEESICTLYNSIERRDLFLKYLAQVGHSFSDLPIVKIKNKLQSEGYYVDIKRLLHSGNFNNVVQALSIVNYYNLFEFVNVLIGMFDPEKKMINVCVAEALQNLKFKNKDLILLNLLRNKKFMNVMSLRDYVYHALIVEYNFSKMEIIKQDPYYELVGKESLEKADAKVKEAI